MCDFSCYGGPSNEWLAVQAELPSQQSGQSIEERQRTTNHLREEAAREAMKALRDSVQTFDHSIRARDGYSIQVRTYRPIRGNQASLPLYMHLHGGGYFFGTLSSEDAICSRIAIKANVVVLNVNYRHTPVYTYPTAWNDAQDAFEWLHDHVDELGVDKQKVIVGGISGGAQIAASLVLEKRLGKISSKFAPIAGQVLMIPCLVHVDCYAPQIAKLRDPSISSYAENEHAPILPMRTIRFFTDLLKAEDPSANDTKLSPGNASPQEVQGLPPTTIGVCGLDPLRDEGLLYAKMLTKEGVPTNLHLFKGVPHGFRRYGERLSLSKDWDHVMEHGIIWALSRPVPSHEFHVNVHSEPIVS